MIPRYILKLRKRYKKFIIQYSTFKTIAIAKKKSIKESTNF